jgi:hypothetical protein
MMMNDIDLRPERNYESRADRISEAMQVVLLFVGVTLPFAFGWVQGTAFLFSDSSSYVSTTDVHRMVSLFRRNVKTERPNRPDEAFAIVSVRS